MLLTAYETLAARSFNTQGLLAKIALARIEDELVPLYSPTNNRRVDCVLGVHPKNTDIPAFSHPVYDSEHKVFVIDTRTILRPSDAEQMRILNLGDYRFQLTRAILNHHWIQESPQDLLNTGELAPLVFMRWLSGNLSRKLGLSAGDQVKVNIVTLFYWYSLFRESDEEFSEKDRLRITTRLGQISSIPSSYIMEVMDTISVMPDIEAFCNQLKTSIDNARLDMVSPAFLYALLGGSWFGMNVKESIAVAVEHPPTFLAMVSEATINRSYRKTQIGNLVYENDKRGRGDTFNRSMYSLLEAHYA